VSGLACTVQPKAWAAGNAATGSELIRTLHFEDCAEWDADSAGAPITGSGRLPQLDPAPGHALVQAAAAGLRRPISFAHQRLLFHPFAAA